MILFVFLMDLSVGIKLVVFLILVKFVRLVFSLSVMLLCMLWVLNFILMWFLSRFMLNNRFLSWDIGLVDS